MVYAPGHLAAEPYAWLEAVDKCSLTRPSAFAQLIVTPFPLPLLLRMLTLRPFLRLCSSAIRSESGGLSEDSRL